MKSIFLVLLILLTFSCQRETRNDLGVSYNQTLIIPPTNDLPEPNSSTDTNLDLVESDNLVIKKILIETDAINTNKNIIDQIDNDSGYETDQTIFELLFKGKKE
tara:strand:+ start:123 stop:434 length:312 start_codon:yes stop_codon:yes gene_type:complete